MRSLCSSVHSTRKWTMVGRGRTDGTELSVVFSHPFDCVQFQVKLLAWAKLV
jgi:hypothetical protein